ncbi:hypothetical protein SFRURICE_011686 [Spodoptera frugiperda]|nr:hypothetical protein SFRURICE_011686 [Spodoptera frugiperda]
MNFFKNPEIPMELYKETDTTRMIDKYNKFWFLCCCPDFWVKKVDYSDSFTRIYRPSMLVNHLVMLIFCSSCFLSLWTQHDLTQSQNSDRLAYAASTPVIIILYHFVILYYTEDVKQVLYKLAVVLKVDHNDKKAEEDMIKQSKLHNGIFFSSCVCNMVFVGLNNFYRAVTTDATFITCISAWPDIEDRSTLAGLTRVVVYFVWFSHVVRNMGVFLIIHTVLLLLSQQYKNLQSYFEDLNKIFLENELTQEEQELKFEVRFKKGIEQHALTLWCVDETQRIFQITFSSHVLLWCGLLISILPDVLNNDTHSLTMLVSNAPRVCAALVGLGYYMWPAGDITVEASNVPHAMYGSGWQCCHNRSSRIRKLVVLAMMQAQRSIELKAFGHFTFSYETYVAIVKMSYSLFSVFLTKILYKMCNQIKMYKPNEMTKLLGKLNIICFIFGLRNIWVEDVKLANRFISTRACNRLLLFAEIFYIIFATTILGSLFTQKNLSEKQKLDQMMFSITLPGNIMFHYILLYRRHEVRNLLYHLTVVLKEHYNDADLEREMIRKIKVFSISLCGLVGTVVVSYGLSAFYRVITAGETFVTITSAWPDIHDRSTAAGLVRVFVYFWWYPFAARIMVTFLILVTMLVSICYQFKNLQSYFYSLDAIFSDATLSQEQKEKKYEDVFKLGIKMHSLTLWCKNQHQHVSKELFATEILLFFGMLLSQLTALLADDRNMTQLCTMFITSVTTCLALGFFMWNGGDITLEASKLSEAMYCSGWQNCYGQSSVRIRKLVVNAVRQAQNPVVYKTLGIVEFSYESYVRLVKMPYSAVSVFY